MDQFIRLVSCGATFALGIGVTSSTLYAQDQIDQVIVRDPCAGYEWVAIPDVTSYNLVVMELPEQEDPFPVIDVELPPAATSWTPTLDSCLEPGRDYLWSVRGITMGSEGDWQLSVVFRTNDEQMAEAPADELSEASTDTPGEESEPAQSSPGRSPFNTGSIRKAPQSGGLPTGDLRSIGETEKNDTTPTVRQIGPRVPTRTLSPSAMEELQRRRQESMPPKIGYETEAEAQAAAERREREQAQDDLARQQNELERQRRQEATKAKTEEQLPARTINAVMDLQELWVDRHRELGGDEYYLVTYKLRGRRGADDRIYFFDYGKQVWPIVSGRNWAKKGLKFRIPRGAGRLTFENIKPFEVYGFVAVLMEANNNSVEEREHAFGFGEFQNEEGLTETFSGAFERAVPRKAHLPDYNDTTRANVSRVLSLNVNGIVNQFGDCRTGAGTLPSAVRDTIFEPLKRNRPDVMDGVICGFSMNVPGGQDWLPDPPPANIFPPPGEPMEFRTDSTRIIGEHLQYE